MNSLQRFIAERQSDWAKLEDLLSRAQGGNLRYLSSAELEEIGTLYRLATSDLARARRDFPGDRVVSYLNRLVSSAYAVVYSTSGISFRDVLRWYAVGFPRLFRATAGYFLLAAFMFFGTGLLSYLAVVANLGAAQVLLDSSTYQSISSYAEQGKLWTEIPGVQRSLAAATIMTNNIQVAIIAFAGGILLGLLTVFVLVTNGVQLGAIFGILSHYDGMAPRLLAFVSGHGVIELSVICLAGGAGFMLADSILRPGMLTRGEALRLAASRAIQLLLGGASLLVIAGTIEGFLSPSGLPDWVKYGTGLVTGVLLYGYWLFAGRKADRPANGQT
jgi:uncharacterized membrane protein SpoIIM required for sporulation